MKNKKVRKKKISNNKKSKRKQKYFTKRTSNANQIKSNKYSIFTAGVKKFYGIFALIFTILGWIAFKDTIKSWFLSDKEKYENGTVIKGILLSNDLSDTSMLFFEIGTNTFAEDVSKFKDGWSLSRESYNGCESPVINLKVKDKKLYISTKIYDFDTENLIGEVNYNSWRVYQLNMLNYNSTDSSLQIIDKRGNNVFSVFLKNNNKLIVRGYFIEQNSIRILSEDFDECIFKNESDYKNRALFAIKKLDRSLE